MDGQSLKCPHCGNFVDSNHDIQNHYAAKNFGHCMRCGISFPSQILVPRKRLIYLDQSFLSDVFFATEGTDHYEMTSRLFLKLKELKTSKKVSLS
jgi:hypothetical protein